MTDEKKSFRPEEIGHGDTHAENIGMEPDNPPMNTLFIQLGVLSVGLVLLMVALVQMFKFDVQREVYDKDLSLENKQLLETKAHDEFMLTQYDVLDRDKGVYQIPIAQAMALLLAHPGHLSGVRQTGEGGPAFTEAPPAAPGAAPAVPAGAGGASK